ncbi:T Cell Receptor Alpha Chain Mc.7.G5 [Manis pentadactyla]|nr:T Cell Receptor Alpha Chain Mc.7.G5 [Manis pentadactyla]
MLLPGLLRVALAAIYLRSSMTQKVTQALSTISMVQKETVTLDCAYETSSYTYYLFWYKQTPSGEMIFLIGQESYNEQNAAEGRYSLNFQKPASSVSLTITALQLQDSAMYFCALRIAGQTSLSLGLEQDLPLFPVDNEEETVGFGSDESNKRPSQGWCSSWQLTFGSGTQLTVVPDIKNPNPAVYQLKSPKSINTSVCLATDFDSQNNVPEVTDSLAYSSNSTVLDMKAMDSKSNGMLAWSSRIDFKCEDAFNQIFHPDSKFPCDSKLAEQSFETDMNLNFQNLSVIGFRLLLLKVVGFNLLMTLRLWSS